LRHQFLNGGSTKKLPDGSTVTVVPVEHNIKVLVAGAQMTTGEVTKEI
jgi:hypothetical protein